MTLADTIARMLTWYDGLEVVYGGVLAALDEATAMLKEAALDHVLDNEAGFEIDDPTVGEYVTEYLDDPRRRVAVITDAKRGEA